MNQIFAVLEYLDIMPDDVRSDIVRPNYERLLPKEEAPGAVVVGTLAWIFVLIFALMLIALDLSNLIDSASLFCRRVKLLYRKLARSLESNFDL